MASELAVRPGNQQALAIYDKVTDPLTFSKQMGDALCVITGAPLAAGPAIALTMLCEGLTAMEVQRRYHFIQGKPTKKADAMLAEWRMNHGGKHRVIERSAERAAILLIDSDGNEIEAELTMAQANESRWPWNDWKDHSKGYKDNWATPLDKRTMLWARLVSDLLRAVCPEIVAGVYTPEEVMDSEPAGKPAKPAPPTIEERLAASGGQTVPADTTSRDHVVDADFTVVDSQPVDGQAEADDPPPEDPSAAGSIRRRQGERIEQLFGVLGVPPETRNEILAKRQASVVRNLSSDDAQEIIDRLEAMARDKGLVGSAAGE